MSQQQPPQRSQEPALHPDPEQSARRETIRPADAHAEPSTTEPSTTEPSTTEPQSGPNDPEGVPTGVRGPDGRVTSRSRTGGLWVVLVAAAVILVLLLVFVLQNEQRVRISFLAAEGSLPLGVALLFAAIAGVLIVAIPGTGRILQLRRAARRSQP